MEEKKKINSSVGEYLCKRDVLALGFTNSMIKKMLPEPIKKRISSTRYACLWDKELVYKVMNSVEYSELHNKAIKRSRKQRKLLRRNILIQWIGYTKKLIKLKFQL